MVEQCFVRALRLRLQDVIWVDNDTNQPMVSLDTSDLFFPKFDGIITQDIEECVVLRTGKWKLDDLSDEVGHYRAAATVLRVEMRHVGNRHVIRELEDVVPVCVAVEDAGAKPLGTVFFGVIVDAIRPAQELLMVSE